MNTYKNYVDGLLQVAETLIALPNPDRAIKCRVVSTLYYALFSELSGANADALIGDGLRKAWGEVYRALKHEHARKSCKRAESMSEFPKAIRDFSGLFERSQKRRHDADYDPTIDFDEVEIRNWCHEAKRIITRFRRLPKKDKRAFAVWVLMHNIGSKIIRNKHNNAGGGSKPPANRT